MRKFVACVIVFVAVMPVFQRQTQGDGIGREAAEYTKEERRNRSVLTLGAKVLNMLLKNAKRIHNNGYDTVFVKSGDVKQAEKDFYTWVSPDDAEETITVCMERQKREGW